MHFSLIFILVTIPLTYCKFIHIVLDICSEVTVSQINIWCLSPKYLLRYHCSKDIAKNMAVSPLIFLF